MGAWATGPFDNDSALDYLGSIASRHAAEDPSTGDIVPGSVNFAAVRDELRADLEASATGPSEDPSEVYAAAGLVAAVRAGAAGPGTGTRLAEVLGTAGADRPGLDALSLGSHCGYVALLDPADVPDLLAPARAAVTALRADEEWLSEWSPSIDDALAALEAALT